MTKKILLILMLFAVALPVIAQTTTGRLIGTVSGPDGLVPGATVTIVDNQTQREITVTANSDGSFTFAQLSFGTYTLKVSANGFKTTTATDLKIDAGREYSREVLLEVGAPQETVTVIAGGDVINSSNAELSSTVSARQVRELPLNGRNPLSLLNTVAGANATSNSINGQRSSSVNYTRDGINVQDNFIRTGGFVSDRPSVDDTGEFTVTTANAGAELGGGGGTQVQLVTPRGGTEFHGSGFIYNRNSELASNRFFNNVDRIPIAFLNRNQFGGNISGPVPVPRFGEGGPSIFRNKGFFFFAYEGFRLRQQAALSRNVLLPQARNGTFSYIATDGTTRTVNVLTGNGLTGAVTSLGVDPTIQTRILDKLPTAGNGNFTGINLIQAYNFNQSDNDDRERVTGRFDLEINDKNNLNFVYSWNKNNDQRQSDPAGFATNPFVVQGGPTKFYTVALNSLLKSNLTNEVRFGYQRSEPFFNQLFDPETFIIGRDVNTGVTGGLVSNPEPGFRDQGRNTDFWNFQDNATYTVGNHSFHFGGLFSRFKVESINFAGAGIPTYTITTTANPNTPPLLAGIFPGGISATDLTRANQLRYLLGGIVGTATLTSNLVDRNTGYVSGAPAIQRLQFDNYAAYLSDQWRITPQLTLNFGVRYDYFSPVENPEQVYLEVAIPNGADPVQTILDPNGKYQLVGGNAGKPGRFYNPDKNNFGPIASLAYSPNFGEGGFLSKILGEQGKTVFRGGFRVSYVNDEIVRSPDNALSNHAGAGSFALTQPNLNAGFTTVSSFGASPAFVPNRTFAENNTAAFNNFGSVFAIDPNIQTQKSL